MIHLLGEPASGVISAVAWLWFEVGPEKPELDPTNREVQMRPWLFLVLLAALGIHPSHAAEKSLTGDEIQSLIIGKTVYWTSRGNNNEGKWFYRKNGNWSGACCAPSFNGDPYGTWKIEGNKLCQTWEKGPSRLVWNSPYCFSFHKIGKRYLFGIDGRTAIDVNKIVDGNPEGI